MFVTYLLLTIVVCLSRVYLVHAYRSSPDIGICETIKDNTLVSIDCIHKQENFCCDTTELLTTTDDIGKWGKKCCSEAEFVLQNA